MPRSETTLQHWRKDIVIALTEGVAPPASSLQELSRRHTTLDDLSRGTIDDRIVTLAQLGFKPAQIADAVFTDIARCDAVLRSARPDVWKIIESHLDGFTAHEVANRTGFSPTYVYKILKKYQHTPNIRRASELSARQEENILRRYRAGEPQKTISKNTGATVAQVKYLLKRRCR